MPTNVRPEYRRAEAAFRDAKSLDEKVERLEDMSSLLPKHKGTDHLTADLKRRLSRLRGQLEESEKKAGRFGYPEITREGAAQVVLIGPPNGGKSSFRHALSNAHPEVAEFPVSTSMVMPGMVLYEDVLIELVGTPPVISDYMHGQLLGLVRGADGVVIVSDLASDTIIENIEIIFRAFSDRHVEFVPHIAAGTRDKIPAVIFANKADAPDAPGRLELLREVMDGRLEIIPTDAEERDVVTAVPRLLFEWLRIVRVYRKAPGRRYRRAPYLRIIVRSRGFIVTGDGVTTVGTP